MSRNQIKWFAMLMMVIDHLAVAFLPVNTPLYFVCRGVCGRIAYPLFIVLFLEGMQRSRHLQRKAIDLCLFALVSEVFFDRALWGSWYFAGAQNVMWSWLLGLFLDRLYVFPKMPGKLHIDAWDADWYHSDLAVCRMCVSRVVPRGLWHRGGSVHVCRVLLDAGSSVRSVMADRHGCCCYGGCTDAAAGCVACCRRFEPVSA